MAILKVKDENGNEIPIPAIRGKSAYQYAKEGGYTGTESEFKAKMAAEWASKEDVNQLQEQIADLDITKVEHSDLESEVQSQMESAKVVIIQEILDTLNVMKISY